MKLHMPITVLTVSVLLAAGCETNTINAGAGSTAADRGEFTILLQSFSGPDHVDLSKYYKSQTEQETGWQDLYVVHMDDHSELYWGNYPTIEAAKGNLSRAHEYRTNMGVLVYRQAIVVPLPGVPVGPGEWNIVNSDAVYSVVVAVFYDVPEAGYVGRKQFAVEYCRQLRQQGYEAYFMHDLARSSVMIGSFPSAAVRETTEDGRTKHTILDEGINSLMQKFPLLAVNGRSEVRTLVDPQTRKVRKVESKPYLLRIQRQVNEGE